MQHPIYGSIQKLYRNPFTSYIAQFLKTNIKTLYTYPKTIWYSARYNAGERFIIDNTELYPHRYDLNLIPEQENEPIRISTKLYSAVKEYQVIDVREVKDYPFFGNTHKKLHDNLISSYSHLCYINEINENIDLPVACHSRLLYAYVLIERKRFNLKKKSDPEVLNTILNRFMDKIEYADAESIAQVAHYLAYTGNKDNRIWSVLLSSLNDKLFYPEFTKVTNKNPHVFRYEEVGEKDNKAFDKVTSDLYLKGYRPVFDLYNALRKVGVDADAQKALEKRFPILKSDSYTFNI
jgi:hypothetical protein